MDGLNNSEAHMTSAAAFVEGGIQDAFEDSCSICLEAFCESDPSTVTACTHEFHLHCILEWCQRSSNCPMCWQPISLKDPTGQELLEAVEREKLIRLRPARNATIFYHPALGDFGFQHLPDGMNDAELEDGIIRHLAAAAAMGRARHIGRREGARRRSGGHGHPHFLLFPTDANNPASSFAAASIPQVGAEPQPAVSALADPSIIQTTMNNEPPELAARFGSVPSSQISTPPSGSVVFPVNPRAISSNSRIAAHKSPVIPERAGPSDFHSLSESWKSRLNSMSMKYKESISKSTKGWKDKLFSRSTSMADIGSEGRREVNAGIVGVSHMTERLATRETSSRGSLSAFMNHEVASTTETTNHGTVEARTETPLPRNPGFPENAVSH